MITKLILKVAVLRGPLQSNYYFTGPIDPPIGKRRAGIGGWQLHGIAIDLEERMKATFTVAILLMAGLLVNLPASASTWNFVDSTRPGFDYGPTQVFSDTETGLLSITAFGQGCFSLNPNTYVDSTSTPDRLCVAAELNAKPINLYNKYILGDITEQGLGLTNDPLLHHEISPYDFINLDLSKLGATHATMWIASIQPSESFSWCLGSNTSLLGDPCSLPIVGAGIDPVSFSFDLDGTNNVLSIIGRSQDVLIVKQLTTSASEPAVIELLGTVLGAGLFFRRRLLSLS